MIWWSIEHVYQGIKYTVFLAVLRFEYGAVQEPVLDGEQPLTHISTEGSMASSSELFHSQKLFDSSLPMAIIIYTRHDFLSYKPYRNFVSSQGRITSE